MICMIDPAGLVPVGAMVADAAAVGLGSGGGVWVAGANVGDAAIVGWLWMGGVQAKSRSPITRYTSRCLVDIVASVVSDCDVE